MKKLILLLSVILNIVFSAGAQQGLTLEASMDIAEENSPSIKRTTWSGAEKT